MAHKSAKQKIAEILFDIIDSTLDRLDQIIGLFEKDKKK
jgi:hypothetical protein